MNRDLLVLVIGGALVALLVAYLAAWRFMRSGYTWADALVIEAVAVIGGIGAVQSYTALRWLALLGDLPEWLADVAPATVDLFAVVMGLAALRARRADARDRYADGLALGYSVAAVLANLAAAGLDVSQHPQYTAARAAVVLLAHTAPVVTFLLGSHWLMRRPASARAADEPAATVADLEAADRTDARTAHARQAEAAVSEAMTGEQDVGADTAEDIDGTPAQPNPNAGTSAPSSLTRPSTRAPRAIVRGMVRRRGAAVTVDEVVRRTGVSRRHAGRLLSEERRPRMVEVADAAVQ